MPVDREKSRFYEFADFSVDVNRRLLTQNGVPVSLTPKVFEMLVILLEHPGEVITKRQLMDLLWPDSFVEESNLTQNVAVLRKALGDNSKQPRFVITVPGQGYKFVSDLRQLDGDGGIEEAVSETKATPPIAARSRAESRTWLWIAALAAIVIAGLGYWYATRDAQPAAAALVDRTSQVSSWSGLDLFPAISPDGNTIAYSSDRSGTFEIYVKQLVQSAREIQLTSDGGQNFQPSFSADGSMIVYHSKARGGVWVVPSTGGIAKQIVNFGSNPSWSPDGNSVAFQSDPLTDLGSNVRNAMPPSTIWIVPAKGGDAVQVTKPAVPPGGHGAPSWSPDGKTLVFDTNDWNSSSLAAVSVATGVVVELDTAGHSATDAIFAPDGRSIIFVADIGLSIQALPISSAIEVTGKPQKILDASGNRVRQPSIDSRGRRLVYASLTSASNIWSAKLGADGPGEARSLTKNAVTRTSLPYFSPDGKKIVYQAYTIGAVSHLWTMNSDGTDQKQISSRPGFSSSWSKDGSKVYFVSPVETELVPSNGSRTSLWSVSADAAIERKVVDFDEEVYNVRVAPDEKEVVIASKRNGVMNLWTMPLEEGGRFRQITNDAEAAGFPCWSPDGNWIAFQLKRGEHTFIAVMPRSGGEVIQLNSDPGQSWIYDWSPNSDEVIFAGQRNGIWNIYSISRTTKRQRQLTNFTKLNSFVRYPSWSPLNDQIAFEYSETTGNIWMADLK